MKIASGCTTRSYDLQKGYHLKCAGRLDKIFWRGIIDLRDRLRRRVFLGRRPTGRPAKAVRPRTIKIRRQGKAEPGEDRGQWSGAGTREDPGPGGWRGNQGNTREPGKWRGNQGRPRTRGVAQEPGEWRGVSRNHANFKKTSRVGVPGLRLRIHRRCPPISAFKAQFWV